MKPEILSAGAAAISAVSALMTTYYYRKQGKGFLWTKDARPLFIPSPTGHMHLAVEIPIFNLGLGNIKFKSLQAKKIYLKNNAIEPFEVDMDEAYFPSGVLVLAYKTPIFDDSPNKPDGKMPTQIRVQRINVNEINDIDEKTTQDDLNKKLSEIGEVIIILKCKYKDGSWFGLRTKTTTIALSVNGLDISFLSTTRRKELDKLFK